MTDVFHPLATGEDLRTAASGAFSDMPNMWHEENTRIIELADWIDDLTACVQEIDAIRYDRVRWPGIVTFNALRDRQSVLLSRLLPPERIK